MAKKSKSKRTPAVEGWGQRLAWLQRSSKLTQSEFAVAIDLTQGMFSRWVNEKIPNGPNATSLEGIAEFYDVRRHWISDFVLKNEGRKNLESFIQQWEPGPSAITSVAHKPAPAVSHHPCPSFNRLIDYCVRNRKVITDVLTQAMDEYMDRQERAGPMSGEAEGRRG